MALTITIGFETLFTQLFAFGIADGWKPAIKVWLNCTDAFGQRRVRFEQADKWLADAVRKKHVAHLVRMR